MVESLHEFVLLRHAESEGNAQEYLQGQFDSPLTELGREQSVRLAARWKALGVSFDRIICSPLLRARQTAEPLISTFAAPLELDPIWAERSFGRLEGVPFTTINEMQPPVDYFDPYAAVGGTGESQVDLYLRACQGLQKLVRLPAGCYLVISHGAILGKVLYAALGITPQGHYKSPVFRFGNLAYVHLVYDAAERQWSWLEFTSPERWDGSLGGRWNP
jgi:2,3-bisphosphoglycerate-dependent phosphoglycerate mutase